MSDTPEPVAESTEESTDALDFTQAERAEADKSAPDDTQWDDRYEDAEEPAP